MCHQVIIYTYDCGCKMTLYSCGKVLYYIKLGFLYPLIKAGFGAYITEKVKDDIKLNYILQK
jgi:hypothetical protein